MPRVRSGDQVGRTRSDRAPKSIASGRRAWQAARIRCPDFAPGVPVVSVRIPRPPRSAAPPWPRPAAKAGWWRRRRCRRWRPGFRITRPLPFVFVLVMPQPLVHLLDGAHRRILAFSRLLVGRRSGLGDGRRRRLAGDALGSSGGFPRPARTPGGNGLLGLWARCRSTRCGLAHSALHGGRRPPGERIHVPLLERPLGTPDFLVLVFFVGRRKGFELGGSRRCRGRCRRPSQPARLPWLTRLA